MVIISVFAAAGAVYQASPPVQVQPLRTLVGARAIALAPAPDGSKFAASMEDNSIRIYDAKTGAVIRKLVGHPQNAYALAWSSDGAWIASGDESARIFIWDARNGHKMREMRTHQRGVQNLSFNYPRTLLISTGRDDVVKVWDLTSNRNKEIFNILGDGANFYGAQFAGKSDSFGVGILSYGARMYRARGGKVDGFFTGHGGQGVQDIDFNPAGTLAVTAGRDSNGSVWDVKTKKKLGNLAGHEGWLFHVAFSPNGQLVASSADDRTVRVWNPKNYQPVKVLDNQASFGSPIVWTADGKHLVTVNVDEFIQIHTVTPAQPKGKEKVTPLKSLKKKKG